MDDKKKGAQRKKLLINQLSSRNLVVERRSALIHELPGVPRDFLHRREVRFNLDPEKRLPPVPRTAGCVTARS